MYTTNRFKWKGCISNILLLIILILALFPIFWIFSMSLKTKVDALAMPPKWVFVPTLKNYSQVLFGKDFGRYFFNSIIISGSATFAVLMIAFPAAYTLSRISFRGKKHIDFWILSTRMAPPIGVLIPYFIIFKISRRFIRILVK